MKSLSKITLSAIALSAFVFSGSASARIPLASTGAPAEITDAKGTYSTDGLRQKCEKAVEGISYKRFCRGLPDGNNFDWMTPGK